jgi:Flp pilus assembly protein TadG
MTGKGKSNILGLWRQTKGAAAVEFAIIGTLFLLIIAGVIDFGHAWYMKQTITNASREGARYGVTWQANSSGTRIAASTYTPTIANYILNTPAQNGGSTKPGIGLKSKLPSDASPAVTCSGAGYTGTTKESQLTVQVTAVKHWFLVSSFIPGLGSTKTLTATTVMLIE